MTYLHTRGRRLAAAVLFVCVVGLASALTLPAMSANPDHSSSPGYAMSFYKGSALKGSIAIPDKSTLDVVWKDTACSNSYGSPPAAFTWISAGTGTTSAPVIGPCGTAPGAMRPKGPDDLSCRITFVPASVECHWTYKKDTTSSTSSAKTISNPGSATTGNLYLYKRTPLYAYLMVPGKPTKKIAVPAGADTVKVAPST